MTGRRVLGGYALLVYVFLYAPILVVVGFAFNGGRDVLFWEGFSTKWFEVALNTPEITEALRRSVLIALGNAVVACILGTMLALALPRMRASLRTPIDALAYMTLVTPEIVFAIAALVFFVQAGDRLGLENPLGWQTILIAHVVFNASVVALVVRARFVSMGQSLEEASFDLGAGPLEHVPPGHAAAARAGDPRGRPARLHLLVRRLHHVVLRDGADLRDAADLHLGPAPLRRHAGDQRDCGDDARLHARRCRRRVPRPAPLGAGPCEGWATGRVRARAAGGPRASCLRESDRRE